MDIKIAQHLGMCNGVKRALDITNEALLRSGGNTLYIFNEIVHNNFVINELKKKNIIFVHSVDEIPDGAFVVFSAHGVSNEVEESCRQKACRIFDATCLLVKKNHKCVEQACANQCCVIFIGKKTHPECIGTVGRADKEKCFIVESKEDIISLPTLDGDVISVAQTTLSFEEVLNIQRLLSRKYPSIKHSGGICYATSERQRAIRELAADCDLILVAGSPESSNSVQLVRIAEQCGIEAMLADGLDDMKKIEFSSYKCIGISAGASTPDIKIQELIDFVQSK